MSKQAVLVPDIGAEAADVIEILVRPGDTVAAEQAIVVLESDKASMEVPCPRAGRVEEIAVKVGQRVQQGDMLLQLEAVTAKEGEVIAAARTAAVNMGLPIASIGAELNAVSDLLGTGAAASVAAAPAPAASAVTASIAAAPGVAAPVAAPVAGMPVPGAIQTVRVPDIGAEEADVIELLVQEGQEISLEQPLLVLESAKASMEVPSPVAGRVHKLLVKVGDKVFENSPMLEMELQLPAGVAAPAAGDSPAGGNQMAAQPAPAPAATAAAGALRPASGPASATTAIAADAGRHNAALRALAAGMPAAGAAVHAGPAVRRLARELGVNLAQVKGSGPRERILKEDVHAFVKQGMQKLAAGVAAPPAAASLPVIDFAKWGPVERQPLTKIQRVSAQNLHRAWTTIPHVTQFDEADITELEAFRVSHKDAFKAEGLSLTLLSFLVKAVAHVLGEFPRFSSSLDVDGETLVMKRYIHVGVAVDTPNGLVVPVIRDADKKSIRDIARELGVLSAKARDKKLTPAEMQGACFSISSLGGIGGTAFTPIVNWPEVAILGVSRSAMRPVWDGQAFRPRLQLPLSLSYDHRVIDGAEAARFTTALARRLGDIRELLL
ncbi:MAG: aceF [Moraxellaceae bacterium]|nr:aceF [Moraxellaceae bacterium]